MNFLDKIISYGLCLFVFLLPWQTRWIYGESLINGGVFEYGRLSLYGTEILLLVLLVLGIIFTKNTPRPGSGREEQRTNPPDSPTATRSQCFAKQSGREPWRAGSKIDAWVILLLIWSAVTIFWSSDKMLGWYSWLRLVEGAGLAWLLARHYHKNIILSLIASGAVQSLLAIWEWVAQYSFASKWLGLSFLNPASVGVSVIDNGAGRFLRAYGSLSHPNILAGFLVVCLLAAIIIIVNNYASQKSIKWLMSSIAVLSMGLFLTFSRAGWLTLSLMLILIFLVNSRKGLKDLMTSAKGGYAYGVRRFLLALGLIILVFGTLASFYPDLVKTRLIGQAKLEVQSNQERLDLYSRAWPIIKSHWLLGLGLGQYPLKLYQDNPALESWVYQPVHDVGILTLAELGIIGLFLLIMVVIFAFKSRSPFWPLLVAILFLGLFDHYFRSFYFGIMLWWLIVGLVLPRQRDKPVA